MLLPPDVCREQITQLCDGSPGTQRMLAAFLITFSPAVFLWLFRKETLQLAAAHSESCRRFTFDIVDNVMQMPSPGC